MPGPKPGSASALIEVHNLHYSRGSRKIFNGLSLNIEKSKITAIMGPSGTGKTTLLRLISGQLQPQSGTVIVADHSVGTLNREALFKLRKSMSMLFQSGAPWVRQFLSGDPDGPAVPFHYPAADYLQELLQGGPQ